MVAPVRENEAASTWFRGVSAVFEVTLPPTFRGVCMGILRF
jgi:hypothetical protein